MTSTLKMMTVYFSEKLAYIYMTTASLPAQLIKRGHTRLYSASHSRVVPENVGLQKEQKCNTFACHTCNEVGLCVLGIRKKEVANTKR
jgi:hypothetical protein